MILYYFWHLNSWPSFQWKEKRMWLSRWFKRWSQRYILFNSPNIPSIETEKRSSIDSIRRRRCNRTISVCNSLLNLSTWFLSNLSFRTRFDCLNKDQQNMFADFDWCNIYHVCVGNRDNIFLCPPGTIFNDKKQGCTDRLDGKNCNGSSSYYKPSVKREKRVEPLRDTRLPNFNQRIPYEWAKSQRLRQVCLFACF